MQIGIRNFTVALIVAAATLSGCNSAADGPVESSPAPSTSSASAAPEPLLLKSLPVDLAAIDWKQVVAHRKLYDAGMPISDFGKVDGAGTANERRNPQPTFFAPLGTPVLAPVDGIVVNIETLYSGDLTIMYGPALGQNAVVWETEHVIDVKVKVGDRVTAGQPVASVSDYSCTYSKKQFGNDEFCGIGIGLTELGYLVGGASPKHLCPFGELTDPAALPEIESALAAARKRIEQLAGLKIWDTSDWASANCIVSTPVFG